MFLAEGKVLMPCDDDAGSWRVRVLHVRGRPSLLVLRTAFLISRRA